MKRLKIFLLLLFIIGRSFAQDYQMFYKDWISFFEYPEGEVIGLRFDSVFIHTDTVLYPFPSIQLEESGCATPYGISWLGKKIIKKADGTHVFINASSDSIFIKTQASLGERWIAYQDSLYIITAFVTSIIEESILNTTDYIKRIEFEAFDTAMNSIDHRINELDVAISKNHGVSRIIGFNDFPENSVPFPQSYYYWNNPQLELVGITTKDFSIGIRNFTWFEVFDFSPGDELHIINDQTDYTEYYNLSKKRLTIKKYLSRADFPDSIVYHVDLSEKVIIESNGEVTFFHDAVKEVIYQNFEFDHLPGEPVVNAYRAYAHTMCYSDPPVKIDPGPAGEIWSRGDGSCWSFCCVDGCLMERRYVKGLGGPYGSCSNWDSYGGIDLNYVYYMKNGETWGSPINFTTIDEEKINEVAIYPNPSNGNIFINGLDAGSMIRVYNVPGTLILEKLVANSEEKITVNKRGFYILTISNKSKVIGYYKIIVE